MKKTLLTLVSLLGALGFSANAQDSARAIELSVWSPVQLGSETDDVKGLRLNLLYAKNNNLSGVDLGIGVGYLTGDFVGIQYNFLGSVVEGDGAGWQTALYTRTVGEFRGLKGGLINLQGGDFYGWQAGFVSLADSKVVGLQTGLFNKAGDMRGLQFGFVNYSEKLYGVQIGLANINVEADPLYFFPFVNASF